MKFFWASAKTIMPKRWKATTYRPIALFITTRLN